MGFVTNRWQPVSAGPAPVVPVRYGVKFRPSNLAKNTQLTYVFDAVGMTAATLNANGFSWGSWENTLLGKSFYPAVTTNRNLVTSIDYKLNPNDYTKKIDGTASNITSPSGNVVSVFEGGWISIYNQQDSGTTYTYVVWSNVQYDSSYQAFHRLQSGNILHGGFTVGCYLGNNNSVTAPRSLSGSTAYANSSFTLNTDTNPLLTYYQLRYINYLSMIMFGVFDISIYGPSTPNQGSLNASGMFYANSSIGIKYFGIETLYNQTQANLMKGLRITCPKMPRTSTTNLTAKFYVYDFSSNSWVDASFTATVGKQATSGSSYYFVNSNSSYGGGVYYSNISPSNYGLFPSSLSKTSSDLSWYGSAFISTTSDYSSIIGSFFSPFYTWVGGVIGGRTYYCRYASFID